MIQTATFRRAKDIARYALGPEGKNNFVYWTDVRREWEDSDDSRKIVGLIGSQSAAAGKRLDLRNWLGPLHPDEVELRGRFHEFYSRLVPLLTALPVAPDIELDWLETAVDLRLLGGRLTRSSRVLDIGPGAARHMVALALSPQLQGLSYAGVEAVGLPYVFQNAVGSELARDQRVAFFVEYLEHQFARRPIALGDELDRGAFVHLPFWEVDRLPEKAFDVVLCSYVLDEVSPQDFVVLTRTIDRVLAPNGIVYARGSQERALLGARYLFGDGSFHGSDITKAFAERGLVASECDLVTDTLTRIFSRSREEKLAAEGAQKYLALASDAPLVDAMQQDFLDNVIAELGRRSATVLIWGDPGYALYSQFIAPHRERLNIVGFTQRFAVHRVPTPLGYTEYPVSEISALAPDAVIFASPRLGSYLRELRESGGASGQYGRVRHFCNPLAVAFRE
ncbi:MAG: class I SAM-dependent methyltransferase [Alphaproteobacteria bacterium]|nr:class I SAM-dependent methyltransferase [Alphaproteobacteria bacterium]